MSLIDRIREYFLAKDPLLSAWEAEERAEKVIIAADAMEDRALAMVYWIYA